MPISNLCCSLRGCVGAAVAVVGPLHLDRNASPVFLVGAPGPQQAGFRLCAAHRDVLVAYLSQIEDQAASARRTAIEFEGYGPLEQYQVDGR